VPDEVSQTWIVSTLLLTILLTGTAITKRPLIANASEGSQVVASGAGLNPPAGGSSVLDPNVRASLDGVNWSPAYAANIGYPTPFPGSNWDFPSSDPFAGYGDPQTIYYQVTFVLPAGATAPSLSGMMSADDQVEGVTLNGTTFYTNPYEGYVYDPSPHSFSTSDPTLFQPGTDVLVFEALNLGGQTAADFTASITFQGGPFPPEAIAGGPYSTVVGQSVSLDGSQSYDINTPPQPLQYAWSETSAPAGSKGGQLTGTASAVAKFVPDIAGTYTFNLTVTNSDRQTAAASSTVVAAEKPPLANAGGPYSVIAGQGVTLNGSQSSDPNNPPEPLTFAWSVGSAPAGSNGGQLVNATTATPTFRPDIPGTFTINLMVTNSVGETQTAVATLTSTAVPVASNGGTCSSFCQVASSSTVNGNVTVATGGTLEVDGTISGNVNVSSGGTLDVTGTVSNNVQVATGGNLQVSGTVKGNVSLSSGASLEAQNAQFGNNLQAAGASSVIVSAGSVAGNVQLSGVGAIGLTGLYVSNNLQISGTTGTPSGVNYLSGLTVKGNLTVQSNGPNAPFDIGIPCGTGNNVTNNLTVQQNQAAMTVENNTVGGNLSCSNNNSVTPAGNTVKGNTNGQCVPSGGGENCSGGGSSTGGTIEP